MREGTGTIPHSIWPLGQKQYRDANRERSGVVRSKLGVNKNGSWTGSN